MSLPTDLSTRRLWADGLWRRNAVTVQLLGLCPLLAVSNQTVYGLGLGLATLVVLVASNATVSALRFLVVDHLRLPLFVTIIASMVTVLELLLQGFLPELHERLGIFVSLIVTNCVILARAESFASRVPVKHAILDGFATGSGFLAVLTVLGATRELLGQGTLFAGMEQLLGDWAQHLTIQILPGGLLIALLPPGAFFVLAGLIALSRLHPGAARLPGPAPAAAKAPTR